MEYTSYGPGDSQTWGQCVGHPNDPRTNCCADEDSAVCTDCKDASCRDCVDRFINDFATAPDAVAWLRNQGVLLVVDEYGDLWMNEVLLHMAGMYAAGNVNKALCKREFWNAMTRFSIEAEDNRKLMMKLKKKV